MAPPVPKSKSASPAAHPAWAEELRRRYLRGEASQFVLHGNVFDLVEYGGELLPVQEYLTQKLLAETKDVTVVFNVSTGGKIVRRKADLGGFDELLLLRERAKFLPAMERVLKTVQKVALIIEYAETVAPAADAALMSDDDRTSVVTLHRWSMAPEIEASDSVVLLLAENLTELHPKLVSNPKIADRARADARRGDAPARDRELPAEGGAGLCHAAGDHHRGPAGGADPGDPAAAAAGGRARRRGARPVPRGRCWDPRPRMSRRARASSRR